MLRNKNIDRICCWVLAVTLLLTCGYLGAGASGLIASERTLGYENRLFDTGRVHTIDIVMEDWDSFLSTCTNEEYAACHLVIDGESYKNVAIRAKGNTSLSSVEKYGNNRYSFKIEFDHYQPGSTYHGLDKLSLNNLIQDNTYLKDYFAYSMMRMGGAAAPLCSFVQINVNGEPWGLYLAVEAVEDSFLRRNYGNDAGELYKPDSMSFGGGRGNGKGFDMDQFRQEWQQESEAGTPAGADAAASGTAMPGGMTPPDGTAMPGSLTPPDGAAMPGGMTPPDGAAMPGGMTPPDGAAMPGGMTPPDGTAIPGSLTPPDGTAMPGGMTPPDGTAMPGSLTPPDGTAMPGSLTPPDGMTPPDGAAMPQAPATPETILTPSAGFAEKQKDGFAGGGMGVRGSSDVLLQYTDDDPASYSNIFDSAKTDVSEADQQRLIAALKTLSEGDPSAADQQAVIRYLAVHNFLCNDDSYTGSMVHNYYLYEKDGKLSMLPWDYNLAFGGFGMGGGASAGATSTVNQPIDSPVTGGELSSRPILSWILAGETSIAAYHDAYRSFLDAAFTGGWFEQEIDRVSGMIAPYVEKDPTAFCTYQEFRTGVAALKEFCLLRAQSVQGQLDGSIPSTTEGQRNTDALVDASHLTLSDMGSMGNTMDGAPDGGHGFGNMPQGFGGRDGRGGGRGFGGMGQQGAAPAAAQPGSGENRNAEDSAAATENPAASTRPGNQPGTVQPQSVSAHPLSAAPTGTADSSSQWLTVALCAVLLLAAVLLISRYKTNL